MQDLRIVPYTEAENEAALEVEARCVQKFPLAMRFVRPDGEGNAWVQLSSSIDELGGTLRLASSSLFRIIETLESGLGLDAEMEAIFNEYRQITQSDR